MFFFEKTEEHENMFFLKDGIVAEVSGLRSNQLYNLYY